MKLSKDLEKELNRQLNMELAAAYQYQAMAAHFEYIGLDGFAKWMNGHASEEREHAQKFYDYILLRGGKVTLEALDPLKEISVQFWKYLTMLWIMKKQLLLQ